MAAEAKQHTAADVPARRILPLVLALILFVVPHIAALCLQLEANSIDAQTEAEREHLRETIDILPIEERTDEQNDMILNVWLREGEMDVKASDYRLGASILCLTGVVTSGAVLLLSQRKRKTA